MKILTLHVRYERNLNLIYYVWLLSQRLCDSIGLTVQVLNQFSSWGKITCKHKTQTGVVSFMADLQKLHSFLRCNYFIGTVSSGQYEVQKARYTFFSVEFWFDTVSSCVLKTWFNSVCTTDLNILLSTFCTLKMKRLY